MADTQSAVVKSGYGEAPQVVSDDNSMQEAEEAILKMLTPETETPESEEAEPTEEEESKPEEEDESLEEEPEESEEDGDEGTDNRAEEGEDLYAVTINGEEHTIPLDELLKGYSRQSDYTRKTQDISEQKKEMASYKEKLDAEINQIQTERAQYVNALQQHMDSALSSLKNYDSINWEELRQLDPIEYMTKKEEVREQREKIEVAKETQKAAMAKAQEEHSRQFSETVREEQTKLVEKLPAWGDPDKRQSIATDLRSYAIDNGFSHDELDLLNDHRAFIVLYKAMQHDNRQKANPSAKKVRNKPRVIRSGTPESKEARGTSKRTKSMKRLLETGHVDDAAAILEDMFNS